MNPIQNTRWRPDQAVPDAFPARSRFMMPRGAVPPLPPDAIQRTWQKILTTPWHGEGAAYLHIPFCITHCLFCGFYRNHWCEEDGASYTDRLIDELAYEHEQRQGDGKINAVYFGGGTPTALATTDLVRLISACKRYLPLTDDCEITLEGRISHFDPDKAQACIDAGINRISIGIQSFDDHIRKRMGRKHSGDEAWHYLQQMSALDCVVVADLIYGLPNQNDDIWARDIARINQLPLSGLDTYAFSNFPGLPINKHIEKGHLPPPAPAAIQAQHYAYACEQLTAHGWQQISNKHYAWPGRGERNRYNSGARDTCLAYGSGAGGNLAGYSYMTSGDLMTYLDTPRDQKALAVLVPYGPNRRRNGKIQHQLDLGYLDPALLGDNAAALAQLDTWQQQGLLHHDADGIVRLNTSGRYWASAIGGALIAALSPPQKT